MSVDELHAFDASLTPGLRSDDDLANLAYFGVRAALLLPQVVVGLQTSTDLIKVFDETIDRHAARVRSVGMSAWVGLGAPPRGLPRRLHPEVWRYVEERAASGALVAIGPVELHEDDRPCRAQLEIAKEHALLVVVGIPSRGGSVAVERSMAALRAAGIAPERAVLVGCDFTSVRAAKLAGATAALDVSPAGLGVDGAADLIARHGAGLRQHVAVCFARGASFDPLAAPRLAAALADRGVERQSIDDALRRNALRAVTGRSQVIGRPDDMAGPPL